MTASTSMPMFSATYSAVGLSSQSGGSIAAQGDLLVADPSGGSTDLTTSNVPTATPITDIFFDSSFPPYQSALQWFSEAPASVHGDWRLAGSPAAAPEPASLAIWSADRIDLGGNQPFVAA